jgi:hypothetical protein
MNGGSKSGPAQTFEGKSSVHSRCSRASKPNFFVVDNDAAAPEAATVFAENYVDLPY